METYVENIFYFYISFFSGFQTGFYQMRWFYPHRSFKQRMMMSQN